MAKDTVFVNTKQIDRLALELGEFKEEVAEATYHALGRAIDHGITKVGQLVPKTYAVKAKEVKDSFKGGIKRPTKTDLTASLTARGHTLSFAHFPFTPKKPRKIKRSVFENAVMVKIKHSTGQVLSRKGFVAPTGAKSEDKTQYNVFMRLGKSRFPIAPIRTLSIPQMITNEGISERIQTAIQQKIEERLEHEITRSLTNIGNRVKKG